MFEEINLGWRSIIDILLVAFLLYRIIILIKGTRIVPAIYGLIFLVIIYFISGKLGFYTLHWLLENFLSSLFLVIIILFHNDIRLALTRVGAGKLAFWRKKTLDDYFLDELVETGLQLANSKIGALIVIERRMPLGEFLKHGIILNASLSRALLVTIFWPNTPLHDGAVIIQDDKITAAACILPLSTRPNMKNDMGTRHRAAIGITEESDALVIVISEEKGTISLVSNGLLTYCFGRDMFKSILCKELNRDCKENKLIKD